MTTLANMNRFNDSFTVTFRDELWKKLKQNLPHRLQSVVALPWKI